MSMLYSLVSRSFVKYCSCFDILSVPMLDSRSFNPLVFLWNRVAPPVEGYRIDFDRLDEMEAMDVGQLPPMTPAPPAGVDVDIDMEERPEEMPPEEFEQLPPVAEQLLPMEEEPVAEQAREEIVEVPDELVPAIEAAAEQMPAPVSPAPLPMELEDVPEVETLRSAVEPPTDQSPDLFAFERETARPSEDQPTRYVIGTCLCSRDNKLRVKFSP